MNTNNNKQKSFDLERLGQELNGRKPTAIAMETVDVSLSSENLVGDYARGFIQECHAKHSLRAENVGLTEKEMKQYAEFLLDRRVKIANGDLKESGRLRNFWIPAFLQLCLENVGRVVLYSRGLELVPSYDAKVISQDEAAVISRKIGAFSDVMVILQDAMPRRVEGNEDVMSTVLIAGYVRSMGDVNPVHAYLSAFLGLKLVQENLYASLYRHQYDEMKVIRTAFSLTRAIYQ